MVDPTARSLPLMRTAHTLHTTHLPYNKGAARHIPEGVLVANGDSGKDDRLLLGYRHLQPDRSAQVMFNEIMTLPGEHRGAAEDDRQPQNPAIDKCVAYFNNTIIIIIIIN